MSNPQSPTSDSGTDTPSGGLLANWRQDLPASIVVFFVAVPLCLGIALASGAPLISGLIAGIVGGIVVGAISGSPLGVSGPAAGLAVIVLSAITDLGAFETFLVAVVLAGAIQIALGLLGAGILGYFFPSSVIKGMLAGIGVLIVLKQIPHAFGHDSDPEGDFKFAQQDGDTTFGALQSMLDDITPSAVIVSVTCLAILILWESVLSKKAKIFRLIQGPLVAVAFGIAFQLISSKFAPSMALTGDHLVSVPVAESLSGFLGLLTHPDWSQLGNSAVWVTAVTIAVVASLETLLCVEATDKLDPQKRVTPTNRELVAQGVGNLGSGLIGGLPITQVIVRSSANIQSGGRTKLSAILHGTFLLIFVSLLPGILNLIPLASLAAILFVVGYKLARPTLFKQMWGQGLSQFLPFVITIVGIVRIDLLTGIGLGMVAAIFAILRAHYLNSHFMHLSESDDSSGVHEVNIELAEEVTFLNKGAILKELKAIPNGSLVRLDATRSVFIDPDVLEIIVDFEATAENRGIDVQRLGDFSSNRRQRRGPADSLAKVS
ncbi:MAG: SulP family inorganic anion transporter [Planctomycetota bacterium]|jgi:MFS superfamily sulfate permease-like transporter